MTTTIGAYVRRGGATVAQPARRQHFIARFYLRNFAEPIFSDGLCVYDLQKRRWERRTPAGVGWFPHLCSMIDMQGNRTDDFDRFLKLNVEDPAAPALKKLATAGTLDILDTNERSAVALFMAVTAARSPELMNSVMTNELSKLAPGDRAELDTLVRQWCDCSGKRHEPKSHAEYLKPSSFGAILMWSESLQRRLMQWEWHLVSTTRDRPFVTSDRPVFAQWVPNQNVRLVTFPVSSEVALIVIAGGQFNRARDRSNEALAMNLQTMERATGFVAACKKSFPGDDSQARPGRSEVSTCLRRTQQGHGRKAP